MGTTPVYALPFQGLTDPPDGPSLGEDLALGVETELVRIDGAASALTTRVTALEAVAQLLASDYKSSGNTTTAPALIIAHSLSFTAVINHVYTMRWGGAISGTVSGSATILSGVHAAGASVTTGSTAMAGGGLQLTLNGNNHLTAGMFLEREFTATASGTYTVGLLFNFFSGSGTMTFYANANSTSMLKVLRT